MIVGGENFLGEVDVAADDGVEGVADHFFGQLAHAREIDIGLDARMAKDAFGGLGDVDSLVADALEIVVDAGNGQDKAKIDGHQLVKSEKLDDAVVDLKLELVDGVFFIEHALGELLIGFEHGVDGLVNGALGKTAHPQEAFFQLVQDLFRSGVPYTLFPQLVQTVRP